MQLPPAQEQAGRSLNVATTAVVKYLDGRPAAEVWIRSEHPGTHGLTAHAPLEGLHDGVQIDQTSESRVVGFPLAACVPADRLRVTVPNREGDQLLAECGLQLARELGTGAPGRDEVRALKCFLD
jgi:hypothetical protein